MFSELHAKLANLKSYAHLTRCFSAAAELHVVVYYTSDVIVIMFKTALLYINILKSYMSTQLNQHSPMQNL